MYSRKYWNILIYLCEALARAGRHPTGSCMYKLSLAMYSINRQLCLLSSRGARTTSGKADLTLHLLKSKRLTLVGATSNFS